MTTRCVTVTVDAKLSPEEVAWKIDEALDQFATEFSLPFNVISVQPS